MSVEQLKDKSETDYNIEELAEELTNGPDWLTDQRRNSQKVFNDTPVPRRGLHLWRYTDPYQFLFNREKMTETEVSANHASVEKVAMRQFEENNTSCLAIDLSGREIKISGAENFQKDGLVVASLSRAVKSHPELVEKYLYQLVGHKTGKFEAMNGALWHDGVFIYLPDGKQLEKPLHILHDAGRENSSSFPRVLIVVGKNSELTVIDEYSGGSTDSEKGISYSNGVVEIFGEQDSRTRYVFLQRQASAIKSYYTYRSQIERGASMLTIALSFGGALTKQNFGITLNGPGAQSTIYGLLFGTDRQHFDNHTIHQHSAGQTRSDIKFKVVLRDKSLSAYTGLIRIEHDAKTCEAYQENRNLLLNKGTRAETIPELEILNEDVSCSHGATIGPIDAEMIFYLTSRGLSKSEAVRTIVGGFVADILKLLPDDLKQRISGFVEQRLENI